MRFLIRHTTRYRYPDPASESVGELRLSPPERPTQQVHRRSIRLTPEVPMLAFTDFFGNTVEGFSVYFRHDCFAAALELEVTTSAPPDLAANASVTVGESRQIANSRGLELFPYLEASHHVPLSGELRALGHPLFAPGAELGASARALNEWVFRSFKYSPGTTAVTTPLAEVLKARAGVCQDFAHVMLGILRSHRIPARYVSGYIEPGEPGDELVGAVATHAWVEVGLPGGVWLGLDPTNNQVAGERHVVLAVGRDYSDVAPVRGSFRGLRNQSLDVVVEVRRLAPADPA